MAPKQSRKNNTTVLSKNEFAETIFKISHRFPLFNVFDDFLIAYHISFLPLGILKIEEKEKSILWNLQKSSFSVKEKQSDSIVLDTTPFNERSKDNSTQLDLF